MQGHVGRPTNARPSTIYGLNARTLHARRQTPILLSSVPSQVAVALSECSAPSYTNSPSTCDAKTCFEDAPVGRKASKPTRTRKPAYPSGTTPKRIKKPTPLEPAKTNTTLTKFFQKLVSNKKCEQNHRIASQFANLRCQVERPVCTCVYVRNIYICIYMYMYINFRHIHLCIFIHVRFYAYVYICIQMCVYRSTYLHIYVYIYACVHVYIYMSFMRIWVLTTLTTKKRNSSSC